MKHLFSIILIGIALSMDTFSLALSVGILDVNNKKALKLSLIVGIMHFIMPLIGVLLGSKLIKLFELKADILLGIILIIIAIQMLIDLVKKEEMKLNLNTLGMFLFALGVSLDSFSVGLGLEALTNNRYLAMLIFSICSFTFTFMGVILGRYASKVMGTYANILGIIILFILGFSHLI